MTAKIFRKTADQIGARGMERPHRIDPSMIPAGSLDTWTGTLRGPMSLLV